MINMPAAVADRLRQRLGRFIGIPPTDEAPVKTWRLPARIVYGPTAERIEADKVAIWQEMNEAVQRLEAELQLSIT